MADLSKESKWLEFEKAEGRQGKKTGYWYVNNKVTKTRVGSIYWYGGFRKYIFHPTNDFIFDADCLRDITSYLTALMLERKLEKQKI